MKFLLIAVGGVIGCIARYMVTRSIEVRANTIFPYGTLSVNLIGSFLIGLIYAWSFRRPDHGESIRLFFGTGFCGGFTTFSAFALENINLLQQKNLLTSGAYIAVSLLVGLLAAMIGLALGRSLF